MNRRRMKKFAIGLVGGLLVLSAVVLAGPHHAKGGPGHGSSDPGGPPSLAGQALHRMGFGLHHLSLNEGQRERIHAIFEETHAEMETLRNATRENRAALHDVLMADTLDVDVLAETARIEGDLEAERLVIAGAAIHRILAELDESQRAELEALRATHRERRAEHAGLGPRRG